MIAELGQSLLLTSLIVSGIGTFAPLYFKAKLPLFGLRFAQINLGFLGVTLMICLGLLCMGFIQSDLSLKTVALNSSVLDPLIYKISALWSNHEGSLLLWVVTLSLYGMAFAWMKTPGVSDGSKTVMLCWFHLVLCGFILFLVLLSNPFDVLTVTPHKGLGLNPLLHDPSMTFHPPTLYFGYIGFVIPFVMALGLGGQTCLDSKVIHALQLWTYLPWLFLTFGITTGSLWAYYELGWGGYWAWDPVENASLLPWLSSTAALHAYVRLKHHQQRKMTLVMVLGLSLLSWLLSSLGTYITRSGIVASVHGFAQDTDRGLFLLVFMSVLSFVSLVTLLRSVISICAGQKSTARLRGNRLFNRSFLSFIPIVMMLVCIMILIIATLAPVFIEGTVSIDFYHQVFAPLALVMMVFMGLMTLVSWVKKADLWRQFKSHLLFVNSGLLLVVFVMYQDTFQPSWWSLLSVLGAGLSVWLIGASCYGWLKEKKKSVVYLAHIGFAITALGVSLNTLYKEDKHFWLNPEESGFVGGYELLYHTVTMTPGRHYDHEQAKISVINFQGHTVATLHPQTRLYHTKNILISKTSIQQRYHAHLYAILGPQLMTGERSIRILYHPFVNLIWAGGGFMVLAGLIAVIRRLRARLYHKKVKRL